MNHSASVLARLGSVYGPTKNSDTAVRNSWVLGFSLQYTAPAATHNPGEQKSHHIILNIADVIALPSCLNFMNRWGNSVTPYTLSLS